MFIYRTQSSANRRTEDLMLSGKSYPDQTPGYPLFACRPRLNVASEQCRPSQGFWGTGGKGHLFQGNRGRTILVIILGNMEHKKTNFRFWGNM